MTDKFEAPKCPECEGALECIRTEESSAYVFNPRTGQYDKDGGIGSLESTCSDCGADVYGALQDAPCNYTAQAVS